MFITKKLNPKQKEVQQLLINNDDSFEEVKENTSFFVKEILLLNKSGLPILSRVYKHTGQSNFSSGDLNEETEEQDPLLISALISAIIQFAETIGSVNLNDIGVSDSRRMFVRIENDLICLITIQSIDKDFAITQTFMNSINTIGDRIFETIKMLSNPTISLDDNLELSMEMDMKVSIYPPPPGLGQIIDNIILETTAMLNFSEKDIENALLNMEISDTTYLGSSFEGTSKKLDELKTKKKTTNFAYRIKKILEDND